MLIQIDNLSAIAEDSSEDSEIREMAAAERADIEKQVDRATCDVSSWRDSDEENVENDEYY